MKILITGANGQLGRELITMIKAGSSEIGLIGDAYKQCEIIPVDIDTMDITDYTSVLRKFLYEQPDMVINCAAFTNVDACESNVEIAYKVNVIGTANLAKASETVGAKFLHLSTDYVFNGMAKEPYREYDQPDPQSIYGFTKKQAEIYVQQFCSKYFIVRTAWLYGTEGNNFVKTILRISQQNPSIKVVNDQVGNPTNANDLSHHILKILLSEDYGIYHVTGKGICSWFDLAKKIVELAEINCEVVPCSTDEFPRNAKRPAYSALDHLMLRCTIGDEMRDWEEAIYAYIVNSNKSYLIK